MMQSVQARTAQPTTARAASRPRPSLVPEPFDVLLAVLLGALLTTALLLGGPPADPGILVLACVAIVVPLLWRTHAPVVVLVLVAAIALVIVAVFGGTRVPNIEYVWMPMLVALGAVAARRPLWVSLLALVAVYATTTASMLIGFPGADAVWPLTLSALLCGPAWVLGVSARAIRSRVESLEAEREESRAALSAEREAVASGIEVMIGRAVREMSSGTDAARRSMSTDAPATIAALSKVEAEGVEAMQELRRFVRRLDADAEADADAAVGDDVASRASTETSSGGARSRLLGFGYADLAVVLCAIGATIILSVLVGGGVTLAVLVFIPALIALLWRSQFPVVVFLFIAAAYATVVYLFHAGDFVWDTWLPVVGLFVALAAVAGGAPIWCSIPLGILCWAYVSIPALAYPAVVAENVASYALFVAAVWLAGWFGGRRRRRIAQLQRDREAAAIRVRREHAQLAHDLHDVIGHSITAMVLQAAGARRILPQDPARAAAALGAIDAAGADALRELEELVQLLRSTPTSPDDRGARTPEGLGGIDDLVERTRPGVRAIELRTQGVPSPLPSPIDATAFEVVREALANAEKHAERKRRSRSNCGGRRIRCASASATPLTLRRRMSLLNCRAATGSQAFGSGCGASEAS